MQFSLQHFYKQQKSAGIVSESNADYKAVNDQGRGEASQSYGARFPES